MRYFMYLVIVAAMLAAYLSGPDIGLAPRAVKFMPDLLSVMAVIYIVAVGIRQQFRNVNAKYWLIFGAIAFDLLCGVLVNHVSVGPILNGMRYYLRAIPFFFLPAVYEFSEADLKRFMALLLGLTLLQMPLSVYQRAHELALGHPTGDLITGTLMYSGIESLFIICAICILAGMTLRGYVSKISFAALLLILVIPIAVNETKVSIFLLPLGILTTFLASAAPGRRILITAQALVYLVLAAAAFVPLYDRLYKNVPGHFSVGAFVSNPSELETYMDRKARVGTNDEAGRWDSLKAPFEAFRNDPIKAVFGLGMGNASKSSLGKQFSGEFQSVYGIFVLALSIVAFIFEFGLLGTLLVLLMHWLLLRDALAISRSANRLLGALAVGYVGIWVTVTIGLFYNNIHAHESISFNFWFFSGVLAAERRRVTLRRDRAQKPSPAHPPVPLVLRG